MILAEQSQPVLQATLIQTLSALGVEAYVLGSRPRAASIRTSTKAYV